MIKWKNRRVDRLSLFLLLQINVHIASSSLLSDDDVFGGFGANVDEFSFACVSCSDEVSFFRVLSEAVENKIRSVRIDYNTYITQNPLTSSSPSSAPPSSYSTPSPSTPSPSSSSLASSCTPSAPT